MYLDGIVEIKTAEGFEAGRVFMAYLMFGRVYENRPIFDILASVHKGDRCRRVLKTNTSRRSCSTTNSIKS